MTSGGKSLYRQRPQEDDYQRPHSVRNLVIGTGVLGAITLICWYGTSASQPHNTSGFIACSAANCPAPTALPMESPAAAQANANGSSGGNPKAIGGSTKRSGTVAGLSPIINALVNPPTTKTGATVGPVVHPSSSAPGTTPTTPAVVKTTPAAVKTSSTPTPKVTTATPTPTPDTTPTTVPPTTVPPTTTPPTTVPPTTIPPTTTPPTTVPPTTVPATITITASLAVTPTSAGPVSS